MMNVPNTRPTITATWLRQEHPILRMVLFVDTPQQCARYLIGRAYYLTMDYSKVLEEKFLCKTPRCDAHFKRYSHSGFQVGDFVMSIGNDAQGERIESLQEVMSDTFYSSMDNDHTIPCIGAGTKFFRLEEVGSECWRYLKSEGKE